MAKPISSEEYIRRVKAVHSDKYDYSCTEYVNMSHKIAINCPIHGLFLQMPQAHLKGQGCPVCGKEKQKQTMLSKYGVDNPMKQKDICDKARQTCLSRYGSKWAMSNDSVKDKVTNTNRERYGVDRPIQNTDIQSKMHATNRERYGHDFASQSESVRNKARQTCLQKYGSEEPLASPYVRAKIIETNIERYGGASPMSSVDVRDRCKQTVISKYGVNHVSEAKSVVDKAKLSKSERGTFSSSSSEDLLYDMLCSRFGKDDVFRNYISDVYPFACDFYIASRDMYIELNGLWTHGYHWFDINSEDDAMILKVWADKNTEYYRNAIYVWTKSDVKKRMFACQNKLNYIVFWDAKLRDAELWFVCDCPDAYDWKKAYSWLPDRDIADIISCNKITGTSANLSFVAKSYQARIFYSREIALWNKDGLFRHMSLQIWLYCNRYNYLGKLPYDLTNLELLRGFTIAGVMKGYTVFDTSLMSKVIEKYEITSVYDPCAGWGERLLYCYCNDIAYYGVDINESLRDGYNKMLQDFNISKQSIKFADSAKYKPEQSFDAVITCPPYGNTEIYSELGAENFDKDTFLNWWNSIVYNSVNVNIKYFCFQVNQKWKAEMVSVVESCGFKLIDEFVFDNSKSGHFTRKNGVNCKQEFESMIVMIRLS